MAYVLFLAVVALTIILVLWGRRVWQRHEAEAIYPPSSASEVHKQDPFFLESLGSGMHGGGSGPGI